MDRFITPTPFHSRPIPAAYRGYLGNILNQAKWELHISNMDMATIELHAAFTRFENEDLLIFQAEDGHCYAGTFIPDERPLASELRRMLTISYHFAAERFGACLVSQNSEGVVDAYLFNLADLAKEDIADDIFDMNNEALSWFADEIPTADLKISTCATYTFGFNQKKMERVKRWKNYRNWGRKDDSYTATFLIHKTFFVVTITEIDDMSVMLDIICEDLRPRINTEVPFVSTFSGKMIREMDQFVIGQVTDLNPGEYIIVRHYNGIQYLQSEEPANPGDYAPTETTDEEDKK